jgi:hypothetical protein
LRVASRSARFCNRRRRFQIRARLEIRLLNFFFVRREALELLDFRRVEQERKSRPALA